MRERTPFGCDYTDGGCSDPDCSVTRCKEREAENAEAVAVAACEALADDALINAEVYRQAETVLRAKGLPLTKLNIEKAAHHPAVRELAQDAVDLVKALPPIDLRSLRLKLPKKRS